MTKKTEIKCPLCGQSQFKSGTCKGLEIECYHCGASLLISKNEDGSCVISARPKTSENVSAKRELTA